LLKFHHISYAIFVDKIQQAEHEEACPLSALWQKRNREALTIVEMRLEVAMTKTISPQKGGGKCESAKHHKAPEPWL
jgi:hypothetical protein